MSIKFAKTKILATLGPATKEKNMLEKIIDAGVDAFRLNFSHGSYEFFDEIFTNVHEVCVRKSMPIPILMDLQGPKIRIGELEEPEIEIETGDTIEITTDKVVGTKDKISCSYDSLAKDAKKGDKILIDDGLLYLEVIEKKSKSIICTIKAGGTLKPRKGMNLPGMELSTPSMSEKDYRDLEFGLTHRIDYIALSFVRNATDILELKNHLKKLNRNIPVIAKIEKPEAVRNFDSILEVSDGIMVARGDLGVEMLPQEVPIIQKSIIKKCKSQGKLVITATQMLESMIKNPVPTRAEASDVANAVLDGTDVVMLSAETSVGDYPVRAVNIMNNILLTTETRLDTQLNIEYAVPDSMIDNLFDASGHALVHIADQVGADLMVVFTKSGAQAKVLSKYRPDTDIIAISDNFEVLNRLNIAYGVIPLYMELQDDEKQNVKNAMAMLEYKKIVEKGDVVLFTAGDMNNSTSTRSWMEFLIV